MPVAQAQFELPLDKYDIESTFDSDAALNEGNLVLAKPTGNGATSGNVVTNFRPNDTNNNPIYPYIGTVNGKTVYFDANGVSKDGTLQVVVANADIDTKTIGNNNILTRSAGEVS